MKIPKTLLLRLLLFLLLLTLRSPFARAADVNLDWLRQQTVKIELTRQGKAEFGSGVVLCQVDQQTYVLTAHHVLFGKSPTGKLVSLFDADAVIKVHFFRDMVPPLVERHDGVELQELITKIPLPGKDLLLLAFQMPAEFTAFATPGTPPTAAQLDVRSFGEEREVTAVGYAQEEAASWLVPQGLLLRRTDEFLDFAAPLGPGFSGGPLFNQAGALIGINVQVSELTEQMDPDHPQPYDLVLAAIDRREDRHKIRKGHALPIDSVLAAAEKWLPATCLPREDDALKGQMTEAYRAAMRWVSLGRWEEARTELEKAVAARPIEGGRIHLQGMRYTEYLPHFHLGRVFYHQEKYGAALREFAFSETQGVIQKNKRWGDLKRLREKCKNQLKEGPADAIRSGR